MVKELDNLFEIKNLTVKAGQRKILDDVSFNIPKGEIFAILGQTGSGKTILVKTMATIINKNLEYKGQINYFYENQKLSILNLSSKDRIKLRGGNILWLPQNSEGSLNPLITLKKQALLSICYKLKLTKEEALSRLKNILKELNLEKNILQNYPHSLSGGMRLRFMLAEALVLEPKVIILDEPTRGIDSKSQKDLFLLLNRIRQQKGMEIILITHDLILAKKYVGNALLLKDGKVMDTGKIEDILSDKKSGYVKKLWQALAQNGMIIE